MRVIKSTRIAVLGGLLAMCAQPGLLNAQTKSEEAPRALPPAAPATETRPDRSAGQVVDDATITARVKAALIRDELVKARNINVDTRRGVVQLKGSVANNIESEKAVTLARQVEGVVRVENELTIGRG